MQEKHDPLQLSARYQYDMYLDVLNTEPVITLNNVRKLLEYEAKKLTEGPMSPYSSAATDVLEAWSKDSRFPAFTYFVGQTGGAQKRAMEEEQSPRLLWDIDTKALTKLFSRCSDTLLNAPFFPGQPDRYAKFMNAVKRRATNADMPDLMLAALAYNEARFGENPDTTKAHELKTNYDALHMQLFPLAHTYK